MSQTEPLTLIEFFRFRYVPLTLLRCTYISSSEQPLLSTCHGARRVIFCQNVVTLSMQFDVIFNFIPVEFKGIMPRFFYHLFMSSISRYPKNLKSKILANFGVCISELCTIMCKANAPLTSMLKILSDPINQIISSSVQINRTLQLCFGISCFLSICQQINTK